MSDSFQYLSPGEPGRLKWPRRRFKPLVSHIFRINQHVFYIEVNISKTNTVICGMVLKINVICMKSMSFV